MNGQKGNAHCAWLFGAVLLSINCLHPHHSSQSSGAMAVERRPLRSEQSSRQSVIVCFYPQICRAKRQRSVGR